MIITKFNKYFEKHGKLTYLVLCVLISVIFVFTVGSADSSCGKGARLTSIGTMYGRTLRTDDIMRKCQQLRLYYALHGQRIGSRENDFQLIQAVLERMRYVHEAYEMDIAKVTDEEFAKAVIALPYWDKSDRDHSGNELDSTATGYSTARYRVLEKNVIKGQYGLTGRDFDEMIREAIQIEHVQEAVTKDLKVKDEDIAALASDSKLHVAVFPLSLKRTDEKTKATAIDGKAALARFNKDVMDVYKDKVAAAKSLDDFFMHEFATLTTTDIFKPETVTAEAQLFETLSATVLPFISEKKPEGIEIKVPAETDDVLLDWYDRVLAYEEAQKRADKALAEYQAALKAGKSLGDVDTMKRFTDIAKPVNWISAVISVNQMLMQQMYFSQQPMTPVMLRQMQYFGLGLAASQMGLTVNNLPQLVVDLKAAGNGALLPKAYRAHNGYVLVYQDARELPATDAGKEQQETARQMLLNKLKQDTLNQLSATLLIKSNTQLVDAIMPQE